MHARLWLGSIAFLAFSALSASAGARAATLDTIYSFCSKRDCTDGAQPTGRVIQDSAGNLYGITNSRQDDVVYELSPRPGGKWKQNVVPFDCGGVRCSNVAPYGTPIVDTAGNLYAAASGGANGTGAIVELAVVAGTKKRSLQVLHSFGPTGSGDATGPGGITYAGAASGLPYDGVSPLYGAGGAGGAHNSGAVFALVSSGGTWSDQVLYSFCSTGGSDCTDGAQPSGTPVMDAAGNLYGTTLLDGPSGKGGNVYEVSNSGGGWSETILYVPCQSHGCKDGFPRGDLAIDALGNLYGVALGGTKHRAGLIFKLVPDGTSSTYTVLHDFCSVPKNCRDGATPLPPLAVDSSGNLFGTTEFGGGHDIDDGHSGGGTVFEITGSALTTLHAFCAESNCRDGEYPNGGLAMDANGDVFGVTNLGGRLDEGTVFEVSP